VPLICGHFLGARTHLYDIVDPRTGEAEKVSTPKETDPPRMTEIPLYVLTNAETYSAAESLAYTLQSLAEAVVVGERTAGGAHPTRSFVIREAEIVVTVPVRNMVNPRTGTNWEGAGVTPDLQVPADLALETALEHYRSRATTAQRPD
jgi:C-terminal processing protease CtpA/Prc